MESNKLQLREEHAELVLRVAELADYMTSPEFHELDGYDRMLLEFQLPHMQKYMNILRRRLKRYD